MITIGTDVYIAGSSTICTTYKYLNASYCAYRNDYLSTFYYDLYYNSSNNLIYAAGSGSASLHVFTSTLLLTGFIQTPECYPKSISGFDNRMYVGCHNGTILVIQNKQVINNYKNGCNGIIDYVTSIIFDQSGYMATSCMDSRKLYLHKNLTYTGKSISTSYIPYTIAFDSKDRFIVTSNQISIYY